MYAFLFIHQRKKTEWIQEKMGQRDKESGKAESREIFHFYLNLFFGNKLSVRLKWLLTVILRAWSSKYTEIRWALIGSIENKYFNAERAIFAGKPSFRLVARPRKLDEERQIILISLSHTYEHTYPQPTTFLAFYFRIQCFSSNKNQRLYYTKIKD